MNRVSSRRHLICSLFAVSAFGALLAPTASAQQADLLQHERRPDEGARADGERDADDLVGGRPLGGVGVSPAGPGVYLVSGREGLRRAGHGGVHGGRRSGRRRRGDAGAAAEDPGDGSRASRRPRTSFAPVGLCRAMLRSSRSGRGRGRGRCRRLGPRGHGPGAVRDFGSGSGGVQVLSVDQRAPSDVNC